MDKLMHSCTVLNIKKKLSIFYKNYRIYELSNDFTRYDVWFLILAQYISNILQKLTLDIFFQHILTFILFLHFTLLSLHVEKLI